MVYEKFQGFLREIIDGDDWEYSDGTSMTQDAKGILVLLQDHDLQRGLDVSSAIADGFGSTWSAYCPRCGKKTMQVVRPGCAECSECGV